jgi:hypothetical protein
MLKAVINSAVRACWSRAGRAVASAATVCGLLVAHPGPLSANAASSGTAAYWVELGQRYETADGLERDFAKAGELYCAAARARNADGLVRLGWMYMNGRGVTRDAAVAHTLFKEAAALGHDMGQRLADLVPAGPARTPACITRSESAATAAGLPALPVPPALGAPAEFRKPRGTPDQKRLLATVLNLAPHYKLDPRLVMALIQTESNFDPLARSAKNAQGLMQLLPETAERFAVRDITDPMENLRGGMAYLRWLLATFRGDVLLTLAAYNAGEGAVERFRGVPPYGETMAYVQKIRAQYPFDRHPFDPKIADASPMLRSKPTPVSLIPAAATGVAGMAQGARRP